jgi:hypothetical protein
MSGADEMIAPARDILARRKAQFEAEERWQAAG